MAFVEQNLGQLGAFPSSGSFTESVGSAASSTSSISFIIPVDGSHEIDTSSVSITDVGQATAAETWTSDTEGVLTPAGTGNPRAGTTGSINLKTGLVTLNYDGALGADTATASYKYVNNNYRKVWVYSTDDSLAAIEPDNDPDYFNAAGIGEGNKLSAGDIVLIVAGDGSSGPESILMQVDGAAVNANTNVTWRPIDIPTSGTDWS